MVARGPPTVGSGSSRALYRRWAYILQAASADTVVIKLTRANTRPGGPPLYQGGFAFPYQGKHRATPLAGRDCVSVGLGEEAVICLCGTTIRT